MVTYSGIADTDEKVEYHFKGLSTDTKPTDDDYPNIKNGSSFLEMDTKSTSYYDASTGNWV